MRGCGFEYGVDFHIFGSLVGPAWDSASEAPWQGIRCQRTFHSRFPEKHFGFRVYRFQGFLVWYRSRAQRPPYLLVSVWRKLCIFDAYIVPSGG